MQRRLFALSFWITGGPPSITYCTVRLKVAVWFSVPAVPVTVTV